MCILCFLLVYQFDDVYRMNYNRKIRFSNKSTSCKHKEAWTNQESQYLEVNLDLIKPKPPNLKHVLFSTGCGFIGRNLVSFLVSNDLASAIRVVDKVPPQVAWLNEQCQKYFQNPIVEFKSANLINPGNFNAILVANRQQFFYYRIMQKRLQLLRITMGLCN